MTYNQIFTKCCTTKKGTTRKYIYNIVGYLNILKDNKKVHPFSWTRSKGRYTLSGQEMYRNISYVLGVFGIRFIMGNDSPRNGKQGTYIMLSDNRQKQKLTRVIKLILANV